MNRLYILRVPIVVKVSQILVCQSQVDDQTLSLLPRSPCSPCDVPVVSHRDTRAFSSLISPPGTVNNDCLNRKVHALGQGIGSDDHPIPACPAVSFNRFPNHTWQSPVMESHAPRQGTGGNMVGA